jgi:hypothetical protein
VGRRTGSFVNYRVFKRKNNNRECRTKRVEELMEAALPRWVYIELKEKGGST